MKNKDLQESLERANRSEADIRKLPVWAQNLLDLADLRLFESRKDVDSAYGVVTAETRVIADAYSTHGARPLAETSTIRFLTGDSEQGMYIDARIVNDLHGMRLRLQSGSIELAVFPHGSNSCYVKPQR
jgi:hypothetical protein